MKDDLVELVRAAASPVHARNVAREYMQARILNALQRGGAMVPLAFHGGTALRFLYRIPRYSEDLDFALERVSTAYDFRRLLRTVQATLSAEGYSPTMKVSDARIVHSAFIRFSGLLYDLQLSPHQAEALVVKIEVDTRPPQGARLETSVVRRFVTLRLQHHDRASLLAGKIHAILQRPYLKGRDLFDLLWYLSDRTWPPPNLDMLNNALRQTGWTTEPLTETTWRAAVRARLADVRWSALLADVEPFLESRDDLDLLTRDNLLHLLQPESA